jgi:molybdopterin synthase catalytic subunit
VDHPIDIAALLASVASVANGAIVLFLGTVRNTNEGREVSGIEYSAYRGMALRELRAILDEAAHRFGTTGLAVEHRLGTLALGDMSVAIAAAHPRRAQAYAASRFIIEELKRRVPIWKLEHYVDGTRQWVSAASGSPHAAEPAAVGAAIEEVSP